MATVEEKSPSLAARTLNWTQRAGRGGAKTSKRAAAAKGGRRYQVA
jgi:hypothetical protein